MDMLENTSRKWTTTLCLTALLVGGVGPAAAADSICQETNENLLNGPPATRMAVVRSWFGADCTEIPDPFWAAVDDGKWTNGPVVLPSDRAMILAQLAENGHDRALTTVVSVLESGQWPNESALSPAQGIRLIRSLEGSLDRYYTGLLLDIYEQIERVDVREAVLLALSGAEPIVARIPAFEAYWGEDERLKAAAEVALASWSSDSAEDQLIETMKALEGEAILSWARRIARKNGIPIPAGKEKESGD